jgi:hypothetical protein
MRMTDTTDQSPANPAMRGAWHARVLPRDQRPWARWLANAAAAGIALSLLAHLVFLVASGIIRFGGPGAPGNPRTTGVVSLAVVTETELAAIEGSPLDTAMPAVSDASTQLAIDTAPDLATLTGGSGAPMTTDLGGLGDGLAGAGAGEGVGIGEGAGAGGGGASFFGVEARGSRFVFIVDTSGSMHGERLALLQEQLITSINRLRESARFFIVEFNSTSRSLFEDTAWVEATPEAKRRAVARIMNLKADGTTRPISAFTMAFNLRPRPDAIYFMTDGEFTEDGVVQAVARMNRFAIKVPIHGIALGREASETDLRTIAEQSGGTFTLIVGGSR